VTLSDPEYRRTPQPLGLLNDLPKDTLPPEGIVDIAVHARGKTLGQIVEIIADKIGMPEPASQSAERVVLAVGKSRRRPVIVLDALDESVGPGDIVSALLSKLIHIPRIRILVGSRHIGSRSSRLVVPGLRQHDDTIDLDLPKYLEPPDIVNYVRSRLLSTDEPWVKTPYRNRPELAEAVARAIAAKAGNNYLCARIVCSSVMSVDEVVNIHDEDWQEKFPNDIRAAFDGFLERLDELKVVGFNKRIAITLLTPLAFGEGEGLPRGYLWTSLANSIFHKNYTDKTDLSNLFDYAAAYIIESTEGGRSVYRLYHEALADYLRKTAPRNTYSLISKALLQVTPNLPGQDGKCWEIADPYIRTHLASYLSKAGLTDELDSLMQDIRYLVCADPERLLRALTRVRSEKARQATRVYRLAYLSMTTDRIIATLTEREQNVLRTRFGLNRKTRSAEMSRPRSYKETAAELALSPRQVRDTEARALRQLRTAGRTGRQLQATPTSLAERVVPASYLEDTARFLGLIGFANQVVELCQRPVALP
jgi:DNA-binding CsgD family transcriptional regulator